MRLTYKWDNPRDVLGEKEERHRGKLIGTWGELVSIPIAIELEKEEDEVQLRTIFEGDEDWKTYSTACFWIGVHDAPNDNGYENGQWFPTADLDETYQTDLDIARWRAGNKAMVHLRREGDNEHEREIKFSLHVRPYFGPDSNDFTLSIRSDTWKGASKTTHKPVKLAFRLDETAAQEGGAMKYEFLNAHGAFKTNGPGNCVHPKQLFTSHAVLQILEETPELREKKEINICYIGPDSTENLRSLGRLLGNQSNKEFRTIVACFDDWDQTTAIGPFSEEFGLDDSPLNPTMESIDKLINPKKILPKMDFVIATYVTPWSLTGKPGDVEKYRKLLKKTVRKGTNFITVDPKETTSCVIEIAPDTDGNDAEEYYTKVLKFHGTPMIWRNTVGLDKSNQCEVMNWRLRKQSQNNGGATS